MQSDDSAAHYRSQSGEDLFLDHLYPSDYHGVFVEAGALDGERLSNTYFLEKFRGWHGLLVEPISDLAAACRSTRPGSTTVCAALGSAPGEVELTVPTDPAFASVMGSDFLARRHTDRDSTKRTVQVATLDHLLDECQFEDVDLLVLDIEGAEVDALRGFSMARWRPDVIVIERDALVLRIFWSLARNKYTFAARIGHNDVWLRTGETDVVTHARYLRTTLGPSLRSAIRGILSRLHLLQVTRWARSQWIPSRN